jgi:hypothetical protein
LIAPQSLTVPTEIHLRRRASLSGNSGEKNALGVL